MHNFKKYILISLGFISVGLGVLGMFLPVLPTTPFLLFAAACFAKSSKQAYKWLMTNKWFGKYISNYRAGKGIPLRIKIMSVSFLWVTILSTVIFFTDNLFVRILLPLIAIGVTIHIISIKASK